METKNKIVLLGAGGHARVVLDCLLSTSTHVLGLFDPKYSGELFGIPQLGIYDAAFVPEAQAIIAIGDNRMRKNLAAKTVHRFANAVHPSVIFSPFSKMGTGNMILQGAIIQAQTNIGNHTIINTGARVDHDCSIHDFVHLGPGSILCGMISVGEGAFVGAGSIVIPGKKIGAWSVVGAGSVVIDDIPDYAVAVGNPARVIKYLSS